MNPRAEWKSTNRWQWTWQSPMSAVWGGVNNQRTILIIDDDLGLSRMVALILRRQSFEVDVANTGDDGLALLQTKQYDAIVLDMRMPGKDGRTVSVSYTHLTLPTKA